MAINVEILMSRLKELCDDRGISLNAAFVGSGVGKNFKSNLKTANPSMGKVTMLANYFGVTASYLIGEADISEQQYNITAVHPLNEKESRLIYAYRSQPEMRVAVDKLLGLFDEEDDLSLYRAAKSPRTVTPSVTTLATENWTDIEKAPDTDDSLI